MNDSASVVRAIKNSKCAEMLSSAALLCLYKLRLGSILGLGSIAVSCAGSGLGSRGILLNFFHYDNFLQLFSPYLTVLQQVACDSKAANCPSWNFPF